LATVLAASVADGARDVEDRATCARSDPADDAPARFLLSLLTTSAASGGWKMRV
jgi:hypothetical protein